VYRHGTERTGGVPSGSVLTNLIDSLVNLWVMHYAAHRCGGRVTASFANGDDGVYAFKNVSSYAGLSYYLSKELGMTVKMDPDKNLVSKRHVRYLRMEHHVDLFDADGICSGVRPIEWAFIGMTGHERKLSEAFKKEASFCNNARWLQQMAPCWAHPGFEGFCLWMLDKSLPLADVVDAIHRGLPIVSYADSVLGGSDETGLIPVSALASSKVVEVLLKLLA